MNRRLYARFKCNTTDGAKTLRVQRLSATTGVKNHVQICNHYNIKFQFNHKNLCDNVRIYSNHII